MPVIHWSPAEILALKTCLFPGTEMCLWIPHVQTTDPPQVQVIIIFPNELPSICVPGSGKNVDDNCQEMIVNEWLWLCELHETRKIQVSWWTFCFLEAAECSYANETGDYGAPRMCGNESQYFLAFQNVSSTSCLFFLLPDLFSCFILQNRGMYSK